MHLAEGRRGHRDGVDLDERVTPLGTQPRRRTGSTCAQSRGGLVSCSVVKASVHVRSGSGGNSESTVESSWPALSAPPFIPPSVARRESALRARDLRRNPAGSSSNLASTAVSDDRAASPATRATIRADRNAADSRRSVTTGQVCAGGAAEPVGDVIDRRMCRVRRQPGPLVTSSRPVGTVDAVDMYQSGSGTRVSSVDKRIWRRECAMLAGCGGPPPRSHHCRGRSRWGRRPRHRGTPTRTHRPPPMRPPDRVRGPRASRAADQDSVGSSTSLMPWTTTLSVWMTSILLLTT